MQKINANLKEAKQQLEDTEYDRYIKETQELLQTFLDDLKSYFDEKLLDLNWVLERAIEDTNLNAETIRAQIEQTGVEVGYIYTDEFTKIWENMTASDSLFSEQRDILASTSQVCTDIQAAVMELPTDQALASYLDGSTLQIVSEIANVDSAVGGVQSAIQETNTALAQIQSKIAEYNASVLSSIADAKAAAEKAQQAANAAQATANEAKSRASSGSGTPSGGTPGGVSPSSSENSSSSSNSKMTYVVVNQQGQVYGGRFTTREAAQKYLDKEASAYANKKAGKNGWGYTTYIEEFLNRYHVTTQYYKKGGVISDKDNPLDILAKSLGEDHMVAAKEGERILTAKQNENFEKLANAFSSLSSEDIRQL